MNPWGHGVDERLALPSHHHQVRLPANSLTTAGAASCGAVPQFLMLARRTTVFCKASWSGMFDPIVALGKTKKKKKEGGG